MRRASGTYSAQHTELQQLSLILGNVSTTGRVIEHSIAVSDDSRRRCLLAYTENGLLQHVALVVESRETSEPPEPAAPW